MANISKSIREKFAQNGSSYSFVHRSVEGDVKCVVVDNATNQPYCEGFGGNEEEAAANALQNLVNATKPISHAVAVQRLAEANARIAELERKLSENAEDEIKQADEAEEVPELTPASSLSKRAIVSLFRENDVEFDASNSLEELRAQAIRLGLLGDG